VCVLQDIIRVLYIYHIIEPNMFYFSIHCCLAFGQLLKHLRKHASIYISYNVCSFQCLQNN